MTRSQVSRGRSSATHAGRIAAGEHVEDGVQRGVGQRGERRRPAQDRGDVVDRARPLETIDDLLGEHVERVAQVADRLDRAGLHPLGDQRALHEVAAVLREQHAPADRADLVPGPADRCSPDATVGGASTWTTRSTAPMSMPSSRLEVATTAGSRPDFSASSTIALLAGHRAVVRRRYRLDPSGCRRQDPPAPSARRRSCPAAPSRRWPLIGQLVEAAGQPPRPAAGVGEDDGAAVRLDQVEHALLDRRPDRGAWLVARRRPPARRSADRARSCPRPGRRRRGPTPSPTAAPRCGRGRRRR